MKTSEFASDSRSLPSLYEQSVCQTTGVRKPLTLGVAAGAAFDTHTSLSPISDELAGSSRILFPDM
jgi:hypothetical protein